MCKNLAVLEGKIFENQTLESFKCNYYCESTEKEQLESIDYQLFSMLGEYAATALFSSTLYSKSERKRQTYQGVVDLLLK